MEKCVILVDLDGTIVEIAGKEIKENVIGEIKRLKENGHILVVATGRAVSSVKNILGVENFNFVASMFGNIIFDSNGNVEIVGNFFDGEEARKLVNAFNASGNYWLYKTAFEDKTIFLNEELNRLHNVRVVSNDEFESDLNNNQIFQMLAYGEEIEKVKDYEKSQFFRMPGGYFDITPKGNTKKNAVDFFKKKFPGYKTIAIGDSENDVAAFENCDVSIAMGNSSDEIKAHATYVTKSISEDGFVYAFRDMLKL